MPARRSDVAKSFCQLCCCYTRMRCGYACSGGRLGRKMMGLVVDAGIINMTETRPSRVDVPKKDAARLLKSWRFHKFILKQQVQRNVVKCLWIFNTISCFCNIIMPHVWILVIQNSKKTLGSLHGVNVLTLKQVSAYYLFNCGCTMKIYTSSRDRKAFLLQCASFFSLPLITFWLRLWGPFTQIPLIQSVWDTYSHIFMCTHRQNKGVSTGLESSLALIKRI